jgi:FkbM family methyltransferase
MPTLPPAAMTEDAHAVVPTLAVNLVACVTRNVPYFRGLGTLYRSFNRFMTRRGAQPLVLAPMKDRTTLKVDLRTNTDVDAFYRGEYDPHLLHTVCELVRPDALFLDIGANIGFYTIAVAAQLRARGGTGRVLAFEPVPTNYARLAENVEQNALTEYCSLFNVALSNTSADGAITLREDFLGGSATGNAAIPTNEGFDAGYARTRIRLEPMDLFLERYVGHGVAIDLVKMDIEGHEDCCLEGGRRLIAQHRPTLLMEVNKPYYSARRVDIDARFLPLLPEHYRIFRHTGSAWRKADTLDGPRPIDNVFLVPEEKLALPGYRVFDAQGNTRAGP